MKRIIIILFLIPFFAFTQQGIQFEHGTTWDKILAKAKAEKKYIFVDAFATWCGPCKFMAAKIFTQEQVGDLFNAAFINLKVQMDTSAKDNEEVKKWYANAHKMGKDYIINAYPTFLFFSPEGKLVHRLVGSREADEFISKAKNVLNPEGQYYSMLDKYKGGKKDPDFLKTLAHLAEEAYDSENISLIANDYLNTQNNYQTNENVDFIFHFVNNTKSVGFKVLTENEAIFNQLKSNTSATDKIVEIVKEDELYPYFKKKSTIAPDWKIIYLTILKKYPKHADEVIAGGKVSYFKSKKDWLNFQPAVQLYMKNYGNKATPALLNEYAWTVFENCDETTVLQDALNWSKKSIKAKEDPSYIDTYANLLYKTGQKDEAVVWEEKAMSMVSDQEKGDFSETIEKMKTGTKTWK